MKTKVDGLRIKDEFGIVHDVTSRCPNGDFKRKYIRGLIEQRLLQPSYGVVVLLGEIIDENQRLRARLNRALDDLDSAEGAIEAVAEITKEYYDGENPCY